MLSAAGLLKAEAGAVLSPPDLLCNLVVLQISPFDLRPQSCNSAQTPTRLLQRTRLEANDYTSTTDYTTMNESKQLSSSRSPNTPLASWKGHP